MNRSLRRRPLFTRFLLVGLATAVGLGLVEGLVRALDLLDAPRAIATGTDDAFETSPEARAQDPADRPATRWILHPFRGVTPRPLYETEETAKYRFQSNVFGIRSEVADPRTDLSPDDLVIGIFGGSFARIVGHHGREAIVESVTQHLGPQAPPVRVVNFALSGYKQPQQSFELAELLLLGVPIDVVVNIDGYNEVALNLTDAERGHHPLYPHHGFWNAAIGMSSGMLSLEQIEKTAEIAAHQRDASRRTAWIRSSPLGRSAVVQAIVGLLVARDRAAAVAAEEALRALPDRLPAEDRYHLDDPCLGGPNDCLDLVVSLWRRGSRLMAATAEAFGADYLHVLQPNQYVEGSKVLTDEERRVAWNPETDWSRAAMRGYPRLREAGQALRREGLRFHDLTQVFASHSETLYTDICCHINDLGSRIIGAEIGRHVASAWAEREPSQQASSPTH